MRNASRRDPAVGLLLSIPLFANAAGHEPARFGARRDASPTLRPEPPERSPVCGAAAHRVLVASTRRTRDARTPGYVDTVASGAQASAPATGDHHHQGARHMSHRSLHLLAGALLAALTFPAAHAREFVYQGQLDDHGAPANGRYDVRIAAFGDEKSPQTLLAPVEWRRPCWSSCCAPPRACAWAANGAR